MDPADRPYDFLPKKHNSLREVGAFPDFIKQRFERCLDLYLCPRAMKRRLNIDPESLVPVLPKPRELRPFPTTEALLYRIPNTKIRAISFSPDGQYFASGSDDHIVRIWEVVTGRCRRQWNVGGVVQHLEWNPSRFTLLS
jgi:ribosome biogenesis protein ERB1